MSEKNNEQPDKDKTELRQDDVSNDMTRSILERNNVKSTIQDVPVADSDKKDDESGSANKTTDDEQVVKQEQEVTLTEDDIKLLEDADINEESLDGKTVEEIKVIAQNAKEKQVEEDDTTQEQIIVSEKDALKAGGFAGNLIGKTSAELLEIINNQSVHIGTQNEKLANPEKPKDITSLNQQNLSTENVIEDENEPVDLLGLSPEEQDKRLADIIDKRVDAGIKKGFQDSPEMESVRIQADINHMNDFHTVLGKSLPEDVSNPQKAEEVFSAWRESVKGIYSNDDMRALGKSPKILITLITDHYTLNHKQVVENDSVNKKVVRKGGEKSFQRIRDMIKNAPAGQSTFNFKRKETQDNESDLLSKDGSESQQMMGRILERHTRQ